MASINFRASAYLELSQYQFGNLYEIIKAFNEAEEKEETPPFEFSVKELFEKIRHSSCNFILHNNFYSKEDYQNLNYCVASAYKALGKANKQNLHLVGLMLSLSLKSTENEETNG